MPLILLSIFQSFYLKNFENIQYIYIFFIIRNLFLERGVNYILQDKKYICQDDANYDNALTNRKISDKINLKTCLYFLSSTFIETLTHLIIVKFYNFNGRTLFDDLILFIPISFIYEIIFDLFHYLTHRIEHENKFAYKYIHKVHHTHSHPTTLTTYYHHPIDLVLTNTFPQIITLIIIPKISFRMYNLIIIYKIFTEISGHSGKIINAGCFPQLIYLPKFFSIQMYTEDHDAHHQLNNCNYSKRFTLWDKIFLTYKKTYDKK
jgi:sterol desaturase/sphingolipid hydroxylase (fatty acid hydroxylase superfamily)